MPKRPPKPVLSWAALIENRIENKEDDSKTAKERIN